MNDFDYKKASEHIIEELLDHGFRATTKIPTFKNGWDTNSAFIRI